MELQNETIRKIYDKLNKELSDEKIDILKVREQYLSKNGEISKLLGEIKSVEPEQRAEFGKEANLLKRFAEEKIEQLGSRAGEMVELENQIDLSAPFAVNSSAEKRPKFLSERGSVHPLMKEMHKVIEIFQSMGFVAEDCRQLDSDYYVFESLNLPVGHPARDIWDTFWTEEGLIPPTQTSTMQNRVLKKYGGENTDGSINNPIRVVVPGRTFRNEATDANHEHTFYQVEGVYVDENISVSNMVGTIKTFLEAFFKTELEVKLQPAFFPFTEPDMEFLMSCPFCQKTGCSTCGHSGWMEIMGCGMIHPNVLREAGLDADRYTGFAWGFGLDRLVMLNNKISDIRWLNSGNLDFLKQFPAA